MKVFDFKIYQEVFCQLPLPYIEEEFKIDINWKNMIEDKLEPPPYVHIRRSILCMKRFCSYLVYELYPLMFMPRGCGIPKLDLYLLELLILFAWT